MVLHENKELFRQAITATAQQMQLRDIYIEKDCVNRHNPLAETGGYFTELTATLGYNYNFR